MLRRVHQAVRHNAVHTALSSEADIGSRKENASKQETKTGSDSIRTERL
jgi:hypothetical protein